MMETDIVNQEPQYSMCLPFLKIVDCDLEKILLLFLAN